MKFFGSSLILAFGSALILACGFLGFGFLKSHEAINASNLIEVRGLSEKVVRADVGNVFIKFSNSGFENLEDLYKKRTSDKEKVMAFLKKNGITVEEIAECSGDTAEYNEEDKKVEASGNTTVIKSKKYFKSDDKITIRTKHIEKIAKIREEILKLSSEGILLNHSYSYKLTNFIDIKLEMMKEASENARKNAEVFVKPQGLKVGEVVYLRQGEVSLTGEDEGADTYYWQSQEAQSINKKLRLVVRAGFTKKK